ncbi:unnamed protein product [Taenia asiatica]|uniref:Transcriptional regulator n=1 Tax=Taenia asiatica TaxID=60517 RepID=A0A0R3WBG9_TAEAS|nr:unnamed protein product [Taenia asiatica]
MSQTDSRLHILASDLNLGGTRFALHQFVGQLGGESQAIIPSGQCGQSRDYCLVLMVLTVKNCRPSAPHHQPGVVSSGNEVVPSLQKCG